MLHKTFQLRFNDWDYSPSEGLYIHLKQQGQNRDWPATMNTSKKIVEFRGLMAPAFHVSHSPPQVRMVRWPGGNETRHARRCPCMKLLLSIPGYSLNNTTIKKKAAGLVCVCYKHNRCGMSQRQGQTKITISNLIRNNPVRLCAVYCVYV